MDNTKSLIEHKALDLLDSYSGANNYILYLKNKKEVSSKFYPTRNQSEYITTYHNTTPKVARKWVELDTYFAKKFAEERYLLQVPEQIYIEKLLVEKDKSYPPEYKTKQVKQKIILQKKCSLNCILFVLFPLVYFCKLK